MDIELAQVPDLTLAVVRGRVPFAELPAFYDSAYTAVAAALAAAGSPPSGSAYGWYAAMPTSDVDLAAGFGAPVGTPLDDERVELQTIPGGSAVVATFVGPYDQLTAAWQQVESWRATTNAGTPRGDFYEEYVTEPSPDGDPSQNVTRLVLPVV